MESISSSLELPCLAIHRAEDRSTVLLSLPNKKLVEDADILVPLTNKTILPTARGYVLARDPASLATFLYSPQSRRKIDLPPLAIDQDLLMDYNCLLSGEPTDPGCVVLLVETDAAFIWYVRVAGDTRWQRHEYDIGSQPYDADDPTLLEKSVIVPIAACRGKFYFNPTPTGMGVIDFSASPSGGPPAFSSVAAGYDYDYDDDDERGHGTVASVFLVESEGALYMVNLLSEAADMHTVTGFSVDVMDFEKSSTATRWRRVDDLGGRAFVLSLFYFGASCEGGRLRGDCVYVAYPVARKLQVFDVKDGSMETHNLDQAQAPAASDKAFWVLPS
ncbi:hypothetical protein ZWY2020_058076 [Hordeum vulgare]|nr:hypothetical protein ZWY2020_058076 [Hordeum vulgare]